MAPTLRKNQAYVPGKKMFPKSRDFWKPSKLPATLVPDAYEMSSGEPVTVVEVDKSGVINGTFRNVKNHLQSTQWTSDGKPMSSVHNEFHRPLQNREGLQAAYEAHLLALIDG